MGMPDIWNHLQSQYETLDISELKDKRLAIDGHAWLAECMAESADDEHPRAFLRPFRSRCDILLHHHVTPVVLFDQYQTAAYQKNGSKGANEEVRWDRDTRPAKVLLDAMGIRYYKSFAVDNEAAGAHLEDSGKVDGYVSPNLHFFLYGGQTVYQMDFLNRGTTLSPVVRRLAAHNLLTTHGMNRERLVALAMLLGCDYMEKKIQGVGVVTALEIVSEFSIDEDDHPCTILDRFWNYCNGWIDERKEDSVTKRKLKNAAYNLSRFLPSTESFAAAVDAYMWPSLECLPYYDPPDLLAYNADSVNMLVEGRDHDSDIECIEDTRVDKMKGRSRRKSESVTPKGRGSGRGGEQTRRSPRWSKREMTAIANLTRCTIQIFNEQTALQAKGDSSTSRRRMSNGSLCVPLKRAKV